MKKYLLFLVMLFFSSYALAATTYYVRDGGGTSTQCTGTTNAIYPGSGSTQPCAFSHPAWVLGANGNGGGSASASLYSSGDTIYIVGDSDVSPGNQAQYMIGYGMPNAGSGCTSLYANTCVLSPLIPGISSTQMTIIKGIGSHQPQLWGTYGTGWVLYAVPPTTVSAGSLSLVSGHGSGDSSITFSASKNTVYAFTVSGITTAPIGGDEYTSAGSTFTIDSVVVSGTAGSLAGVIVAHSSNGPPSIANASGYFGTASLAVVSGHGSGDSSITFSGSTYSWEDFIVSGVVTAPQVGDEYKSAVGVTYDIVGKNISSGSGTIQANAEINMDIENIEITQHSSCSIVSLGSSNPTYNNYPAYCNSSSSPYNTWVQWGIYLEGTNLVTKNNWWHNISKSVISFPGNVSNWSSTNDKIDAAGFALDDTTAQGPGSGVMNFGGTNTMTGDIWAWGGVMEKYPLPDPSNVKDTSNYINGCDQVCGGLGGGFMQQNDETAPCGNWNISYSQFLFNLKTNIDFLHCDGTGTFNLYRSRSEGAEGESLKLQVATANLEEDQLLGNAPVWSTANFQSTLAPYSTSNSSWITEICRGGANTIFSVNNGMTVNYVNDDLAGNCNSLIETANNFSPAHGCSGMTINAYNTKLIGGWDYGNGDYVNISPYYDGSSGGSCSSVTLNQYNDSCYNARSYGGYSCISGTNTISSDPLVVGEVNLGPFIDWMGQEGGGGSGADGTGYYGGTNLGDELYLQSSSPLRGAWDSGATFTNGSSNDYNYVPNTDGDIGSMTNNTCVSTSNGTTTGFCSNSNCCSGNTCSSYGMCLANGGSNIGDSLSGSITMKGITFQ